MSHLLSQPVPPEPGKHARAAHAQHKMKHGAKRNGSGDDIANPTAHSVTRSNKHKSATQARRTNGGSETMPSLKTVISRPGATKLEAEPEGNPMKKAREAKLRKPARSGMDRLSRTEFLSALNGGIKPEDAITSRPRALTPRRYAEPVERATMPSSVQDSPLSLIDHEQERKRDAARYTSEDDERPKKKQRRSKNTKSNDHNEPIAPTRTDMAANIAPALTTPNSDTKDKVVNRQPTGQSHYPTAIQRPCIASSSQAIAITMPTQVEHPALRIQAQISDSEDRDPNRRQEVAQNYPKAIGRVVRKRTERSMEEIKTSGGRFTQQEVDMAYQFRDDFCLAHNITVADFNNLAHGEQRTGGLTKQIWQEYKELFNYRTGYTLRKIFRRQFDPYERRIGWTKEEDEQLRDAILRFGLKWTKIGPAIARHPEICRDRYRNYLQYDNMKMEMWSADEVVALRMAVGSLMYKVWCGRYEEAPAKTKRKDISLSNDECRQLIRWHAVALQVPLRSRLQCHQKWLDMEQSGQADYQVEIERARQREAGKSNPQSQYYVEQPEWLLTGDKLRLCRAIAKLQAELDAELDWNQVRKQSPKLKIFRIEQLRETWQQLRLEFLKEAENASDCVGASKAAKKIKRRLKRAAPDGKQKESWASFSRAERPKPPRTEKKSKYKSSALVEDSDTSEG